MHKKGQAGEAIKYIIIAAIILFVTIFGFAAISKVKQKLCDTDLAKFKLTLDGVATSVKSGSTKDINIVVPCGIDEVYFFDKSGDIDLSVLPNVPLMKDSITSGVEENLFLLKDNKLVDSLYVGNLDLDYPNYLCLVPKGEKINFFIDGKGSVADIIPACFQPECTVINQEQTDIASVNLLREAKSYGETTFCENCPRDVTTGFAQFIQTRENSAVTRKYEYCRETGITNVEVTITPKGRADLHNYIYYEKIPKECIDNIHDYLVSELDDSIVDIKADPLIMWRLGSVSGEQKVSYSLNTVISDRCKEVITGIGVARLVENGNVAPVPELPDTGVISIDGSNTAPELSIPGKQIDAVVGVSQTIYPNLARYAKDAETNPSQLGYSIVSQSNINNVECNIIATRELSCTPKINDYSFTDITIEAFDGSLKDTQVVRLRLNRFNQVPVCGDGVCAPSESCSSCSADCSCEIEGPKRLRCGIIQDFCEREVDCPDGFTEFGDQGQCECGLTCKISYQCVQQKTVSDCSENPQCPPGFSEIGQVGC